MAPNNVLGGPSGFAGQTKGTGLYQPKSGGPIWWGERVRGIQYSFTRASEAHDGEKMVGNDVPRVYGEKAPVILLEGERTNLITYSKDVGDAGWFLSPDYGTYELDVAVAPDGTMTADKLIRTGESEEAGAGKNAPFVSEIDTTGLHTYSSIFVRNLTTPHEITVTANFHGGGNDRNQNYSSYLVGTEWTRITAYVRAERPNRTGRQLRVFSNYADEFLAWGGQIEGAPFPSSYISTLDSQASRAPDLLTIDHAPFNLTDDFSVNLAGYFDTTRTGRHYWATLGPDAFVAQHANELLVVVENIPLYVPIASSGWQAVTLDGGTDETVVYVNGEEKGSLPATLRTSGETPVYTTPSSTEESAFTYLGFGAPSMGIPFLKPGRYATTDEIGNAHSAWLAELGGLELPYYVQ